MELEMNKCILCGDTARERKYFFKSKPLCSMHYAEYLEFLIDDKGYDITSDNSSNAFNKYKLSLEPQPLSESERENKEKREQEAREEEKKISFSPTPRPYTMRM
jgi:hypothetical protein